MDEKWKDVCGWEGIYQVSNKGRLKSFKGSSSGRILKNTNKTGGYFSYVLQANGRNRRTVRMHRLVAEAFIPNPDSLPCVNHKDRNKQNNRVDNLEWVTYGQNNGHSATTNPRTMAGFNRWNKTIRPKVVIQRTLSGKFVKAYLNCQEAGRETGVCPRNIHQVSSKTEYRPGKTRKQAGGYRWEFA